MKTKFPTEPKRSIYFRPKFQLLFSKVGLETRIFENGTARFCRTGPTGQRGPPLEVDHFFRKIYQLDRSVPFMFRPKFPGSSLASDTFTLNY